MLGEKKKWVGSLVDTVLIKQLIKDMKQISLCIVMLQVWKTSVTYNKL